MQCNVWKAHGSGIGGIRPLSGGQSKYACAVQNHDDSINHLKGEMAELKAAFKAMKMEQPGHKGANMQQV